jgi:Rrf2 family protein
MLRLSKKADYGLMALIYLAGVDGFQSASAKEIADAHDLPLPMLAKVLQRLAKSGLLEAEHGTKGGYRLARRPDTISALEAILAIDGPVIFTSCSSGRVQCGQTSQCTARRPLARIREDIQRLLSETSIYDMYSGEKHAAPLVSLGVAGDQA